jgi:hypothetical protein
LRRTLPLLTVLAAAGLVAAVPAVEPAPPPRAVESPPPGVPPAAIPNPDYVCRIAAWWVTTYAQQAEEKGRTPEERAILRKAAEDDTHHWWFVAWHGTGLPRENLDRQKTAASFWLNNLHFATSAIRFRDVPRSNGLLQWVDIREPGWSRAALTAVSRRDLMFREPAVDNRIAEFLRRSIGVAQDPKTLAVEAVVWGPQLLRDSFESQRSPTYYDLLFSAQRFVPTGTALDPPVEVDTGEVKWRTEKRTVDHPGGEYRYPDDSGQVVQAPKGQYEVELRFKVPVRKLVMPRPNATSGFKFVDFPQTLEDWEDAFRIKGGKARAVALGKAVRVFQGAIVAGYSDDPVNGSVVARKNRAVRIEQGEFGPVMETYDAIKGTGTKNYIEQAPRLARGEELDADAFEVLAGLPAGGQATGLFNGQRKRIEVADGGIAKAPEAANKAHKHVNFPNVRTGADCMRCHCLAYGVIPPRDLVKDVFDVGVDLKLKNPADAVQFAGVFGKIDRRLAGYQGGYKGLIEDVTGGPDRPAWTPAQLVGEVEEGWDRYDRPVDRELAAAEMGVPVAILNGLAVSTLGVSAKLLVQGRTIPRDVWDEDVRPELVRVLAADKQVEIRP